MKTVANVKTYLEAFAVREGLIREGREKQKFWTRIGTAYPTAKESIVVWLEAIPPVENGQYKIVLLPPKTNNK